MLTQALYSQFRVGWGPLSGNRIALAKALIDNHWLCFLGVNEQRLSTKYMVENERAYNYEQDGKSQSMSRYWKCTCPSCPRCHWPVGDVPRSFTPSSTGHSLRTLVGSHVCLQPVRSPVGQTQRCGTVKKFHHTCQRAQKHWLILQTKLRHGWPCLLEKY